MVTNDTTAIEEEFRRVPFFNSYDPQRKMLTLRGATHIPSAVLALADHIEILDAAHGEITALPEDFGQLKKLTIAFFSHNNFTEVPRVLAQCPRLALVGFKSCRISHCADDALPTLVRWLILTNNYLEQLPASLGKLTRLQKLSLAGNRLRALPEAMAQCKNLELIRISANALSAPPAWLGSLPRLAWYGDAGNPFSRVPHEQSPLPDIAWDQIQCAEKIGASPSSEVFKARWRTTNEEIALKLFRGDLTSDGFPADDMRAALAAGTHDNLIPILGRLICHPENKQGLVLGLIPATYTKLGLPPDFTTCTRDTYPADASFSVALIVKILQGVAAACRHMHERGIAHGDLYAHNMLVNAAGHCLVGDFGAASFYDAASGAVRERWDVRAFGYLLADLLYRRTNDAAHDTDDVIAKLFALERECLAETVAARPSFQEIEEILHRL